MKKSSRDPIRLQHEEAQLLEVCGIPCSMFHVSFFSRDPVDVGLMYLKLDGTWHRFYLDAGLLFWREGLEPDRDNDLVDGEDEYVDWGSLLGVVGVPISKIFMKDSELTMHFANGAEIALKRKPLDDTTSILRFKPGE